MLKERVYFNCLDLMSFIEHLFTKVVISEQIFLSSLVECDNSN